MEFGYKSDGNEGERDGEEGIKNNAMTGPGNRPEKLQLPCSFFYVAMVNDKGIKKHKKLAADE